jgi:hypothetical protein
MSHDGNTRLLEQLYEQFLEEGHTEEEAARLARELFDRMD